MLRVPHLARPTDFICTCLFRSCVEWGSTNTSWHIGVHYVKSFTHTQGVKLKHNGIWGWGIYIRLRWMGHLWLKWVGHLCLKRVGIYGLNGWGIYDLNGWGSYGKVSYCFLGDILKKHWSSEECPFRSSHDHGFRSPQTT